MNIGMHAAKMVDFDNKLAPKNQMKALYAATIAARLAASRSQEEFRETFTRDLPGWLTLFYVASIVENAVGYLLDAASKSCSKDGAFSLIKGPEGKNFLKMLNPFSPHRVRSFKDIEALQEIANPENLKALKRNKAVVFAVGMLSSIAVLGVLIPWFNVQITRKEVLEEGKDHQKTAGNTTASFNGNNKYHFSSKLNLTPNSNLKPGATNVNYMA